MSTPTICLTFDEWPEAATAAYGIMQSKGLIGTYFVTPSMIDGPSGPAFATLLSMRQYGWEIGAYSGVNMFALESSNRVLANDKLRDLRKAFWDKGLPVTTLAAAQRAWGQKCRQLAEGLFDRVRVADNFVWQSLPIPDPLWIRDGGTQSLSSADTVASLSAQLDALIAAGGCWIVVIHRVSDDGAYPAYTVNKAVFSGFCAKIQSEIASGKLRQARIRDL